MLNGLFGIKNARRKPSSPMYSRRDFEVAHEGPVSCLNRAGKPGTCVSGGHDSKVVLYDYFSGKTIRVWTGHQQRVTRVAYGDVANMLASGSKDRTIRLWTDDDSIKESGLLTTIDAHDLPITGLAFNSDNTLLCSGSRDNSLKIWDVSSGNLIRKSTIARNLVTHLAWIPSSNILVQTSEDRELRLWDHRLLEVVSAFPKSQHIQTHCDVTPDGNYIVTGSNGTDGNGCEASLWDVRTCQLIHEFKGHRQTINSCLFVRTADYRLGPHHLITVSQDGSARLWNRDTTECLCVWLTDDGGGAINDIAHLDDDSFGVATYHSGIHRLLRGFHSTGRWILKKVSNF